MEFQMILIFQPVSRVLWKAGDKVKLKVQEIDWRKYL